MCTTTAIKTGAPRSAPVGDVCLAATDRADDAPDDPEDAEAGILADHDRRVFLIGGHELDPVPVGPVVLDRGLFIEQRDDDLAGARGLLLLDDDVVALQDPRVDHAVAAHLEREQVLGLPEQLTQLQRPGPVLLGEDRLAGGDPAQDRDAVAGYGGGGRPDAAGDAAGPADVARLLEQVQVVAHAVRG